MDRVPKVIIDGGRTDLHSIIRYRTCIRHQGIGALSESLKTRDVHHTIQRQVTRHGDKVRGPRCAEFEIENRARLEGQGSGIQRTRARSRRNSSAVFHGHRTRDRTGTREGSPLHSDGARRCQRSINLEDTALDIRRTRVGIVAGQRERSSMDSKSIFFAQKSLA